MTVRGTLQMQFEYDEDNFEAELTDEFVKDLVQDTALAHPEMVYNSIEVIDDPGPQDGLSHEALNQLEAMDPTETPLSSLDIGDIFSMGRGNDFYVLVDMVYFDKHRDTVWAYANAATGKFEGLIRDGNNPDHFEEPVDYYGHQRNL